MITNLFSGATDKQMSKIKRQNNIQKEYMAFVYNNPNLEIKVYEDKYKLLMQTKF